MLHGRAQSKQKAPLSLFTKKSIKAYSRRTHTGIAGRQRNGTNQRHGGTGHTRESTNPQRKEWLGREFGGMQGAGQQGTTKVKKRSGM